MNVIKRILGTTAFFAALTAASVLWMPEYVFTQHISTLLTGGLIASVLLTAVSLYSEENLTMHDKEMLMNGFLIAILVPTFYTAGAFVHESQTSWSGGEIHWHADFEVLVEEEGEMTRLDPINPEKFCQDTEHEASYMCKISDRTGSTEYHEHNDNRIHLEGTFRERSDASLSAFFEQFQGELTNDRLVLPTNDGVVEKTETGIKTLKIIVKKGTAQERDWCVIGPVRQEKQCVTFDGKKAHSPSDYVISPYTQGPNLDDIFIIYDSTPTAQAISDLRQDDKYRGFGLLKQGEGYSG